MELTETLKNETVTKSKAALPPGARLLFLAITGSHSYGTAREDSDLDVRGVFAHEPVNLFGIDKLDTNARVDGEDIVIWSLQSFLSQILSGSPNATEVLFSPWEFVIFKDKIFKPVLDAKFALLSSATITGYRGMAKSQHLSTKQAKDPDSKQTKKAASHYLRLSHELLNLLGNGCPKVQLAPEIAKIMVDAKMRDASETCRGAAALQHIADVLITLGDYPQHLMKEPDRSIANNLCSSVYLAIQRQG